MGAGVGVMWLLSAVAACHFTMLLQYVDLMPNTGYLFPYWSPDIYNLLFSSSSSFPLSIDHPPPPTPNFCTSTISEPCSRLLRCAPKLSFKLYCKCLYMVSEINGQVTLYPQTMCLSRPKMVTLLSTIAMKIQHVLILSS